ncbi:hypothetical protein P278_16070 [Zhouia amylolytica AD3]|uniref:Peptidase M20 dimerisation domain-containing protein n=2 Tax=Zhouia amylolytica TaxID=376730 RepID=W2UP01_9FLAO|nr:hypothetical protein P278_16070 [Zhouia amylolytica AD3]
MNVNLPVLMKSNKTFYLEEDLENIRHYFHAHPELSAEESHTAKRVTEFLQLCHPDKIITKLGGNGIAAIFCSKNPGKTILYRCEMDALPIEESNHFRHRSKVPGVSHKCGHDGHLTVMLGLARLFKINPIDKGTCILLFQPAEEIGLGAEKVLNDPKFQLINPDYVYAFHNLPGYPLNKVVLKEGAFSAAVKSLIIQLKGKTAHAGEPEKGINPALAVSEIISQAMKLSHNHPDQKGFKVVTPVHMKMGEVAYGIAPGDAEIHFTLRTWQEHLLDELTDDIIELSKNIAQKYELKINTKCLQHFRANENKKEAIAYLKRTLNTINQDFIERSLPFKWGEDFGLFTQRFNGAMFGIGAGINCPALHNPDYDFPDEITPKAIDTFYNLMLEIQK